MKAAIIYEDKEILVIHKPAGIATQTARLGQADIESELKNYLHQSGQNTYLGMVHRLDQPVEGLLVFAKTPAAAKVLSAQLQSGTLKKYYQALVPDCFEGCRETAKKPHHLVDYLWKDSKTNLSQVVEKGRAGAKKAELCWHLAEVYQFREIPFALVDIELYTGRHHQIRVQMSHAGMPLLGDSKYGTKESADLSAKLGVHQTALLANRLVFLHPSDKRQMSFELPYPVIWKNLMI